MAHREDLEAAGVGDDGPLPAHEGTEAAEALDQLGAGVEQQVEGVAEHHLVAQRRDLLAQQAFDGRLRGERHEGGRANVAVRRVQRSRASAGGAVAGFDRERGHRGILRGTAGGGRLTGVHPVRPRAKGLQ